MTNVDFDFREAYAFRRSWSRVPRLACESSSWCNEDGGTGWVADGDGLRPWVKARRVFPAADTQQARLLRAVWVLYESRTRPDSYTTHVRLHPSDLTGDRRRLNSPTAGAESPARIR